MAMDYALVQRVIDGTGMILDTTPGNPDTGSYVTEAQLRDWIKAGILFSGYYHNGDFYSDSGHTTLLAKVEGALYVDKTNANKALYVCLSSTYQSLTEEAQVQAIIDGLNDGTIVPLKAMQDQNGNVIDQTYETKADASDLKDAISANSARISNLEQEHGGYSTVQYRGTNAVPTGKAKNALVESIVGKTRAWNQMVQNGDFSDGKTNWDDYTYRGTLAASDGVLTYTVTELDNASFANRFGQAVSISQGKNVLVSFDIYCSKAGSHFVRFEGASYPSASINAVVGWNHLAVVIVAPSSMVRIAIGFNASGLGYALNDVVRIREVVVRDLTVIFPDLPSTDLVTSNIQNLVRRCPDLLKYDSFGYSLVDTTLSVVRSVGVNIWDEEWLNGYYSGATFNSDNRFICSKNLIPVITGETYYFLIHANIEVFGYDYNGNYAYQLSGNIGNGGTLTIPVGIGYIKFSSRNINGWTTYDNDSQICLNSYSDKTTYHPHMTDTLSLPQSVTLRSADNGSVEVHDELDVETGIPVTRVGYVDLSTLTWSGAYGTTQLASVMKLPTSNSEKAIITCDNPAYTLKTVNSDSGVAGSGDMFVTQGGNLVIRSSSTPTGHITYALATESEGTSIGTSNPMIQTEGGGTINTIQTQTTKIDNCLDVGYLAL